MSDPRDPQLPAALRDELDQLWSPGPPPSRVREALQTAARAQLRPSPWRRWRPLLLAGVSAAAAGLLVMIWLQGRPDPSHLLASLDPADVNADRTVDILDARDLARHLRDGARLERRWDVNGDGDVDLADVEAAAYQAVRIDR